MTTKSAQNIPLSQQPIYPFAKVSQNGSINFGAIAPIWLYFFNESYANANGYNYTANGLIYADSNGVLTSTSAPTNGQILIGSSGTIPQLSTLSSSQGINISNGPGTISIQNTGVLSLEGTLNQLVINPDTGIGNLIVSLPGTLIAPGTMSAETYNVRGNNPLIIPQNGLYLTATPNTLAFSTNSTYAMKISSSQNLLIGVTSDTGQTLQVKNSELISNSSGAATLKLQGSSSSKTFTIDTGDLQVLNYTNTSILDLSDSGQLTVADRLIVTLGDVYIQNGNLTVTGNAQITAKFGCNGKLPQASVPGTGGTGATAPSLTQTTPWGFASSTDINAIYAAVTANAAAITEIYNALVANGIMS